MDKTTNLELNKPTMTDFVSDSVAKVFGDNFDIIDEKISDIDEDISQLSQNKADKSHTTNTNNPHNVSFNQTIVQLSSSADFNDISDGMFFFRNNTANAPVTGTGLAFQVSPSGGVKFQMAVHDYHGKVEIYYRSYVAGSWSVWYSSLSSPAFTDTPTAPTATVGTNNNQIATTAFVAAAIGAISITKEAVGLGNVPNVSTNDQTPTYSAAASLATLVSGEKLSVSMGKIMLAVTNLINHLANTSNPHSVTASQIGAAASSHNHSASNITSGTLPVARGGTGITTLTGVDYDTSRVRGFAFQTTAPDSITNGHLVGVYT